MRSFWAFVITVVLLVLLAVACTTGTPAENEDDGLYQWQYVSGPNGETCLIASRMVGFEAGVAMMDCDTVNARP